MVIKLDENMSVQQHKLLAQCAPRMEHIGLSWGANDSIYFTDTGIQLAAQKIYHLDTITNKRTIFASPQNTDGRGYYRLHYNHQTQQLYALLNNNWYGAIVVTFAQNGHIESQHDINYPLYSVTSYNNQPAFKTAGNHIHFLNNNNETRLMQSPLWPIYSPNIVTNGDQTMMAFIGGDFSRSELVHLDLENQTRNLLVSGEVSNKLPIHSHQGNLYYISNRSGVYQIWRFQEGRNEQISQFESNMYIHDLKISWDEKLIALTTDSTVYVFKTDEAAFNLKQVYLKLDQHVNPYFSPDSKTLWATELKDGIYLMNQVALEDNKGQKLTTLHHGYIGIYDTKTKDQFVFKYDQPGAWKVKNNKLEWFNHSPIIYNSEGIQLHNHVLTYYSERNYKLLQLSLDDGEETVIADEPFRRFTQINHTEKDQTKQFIVSRRKFGNTDIYIAYY